MDRINAARTKSLPEGSRHGRHARAEDGLLIPIWLGLVLSLSGFILVTVCGLFWTNQGLSQWGFRAGVALMLLGFTLTIAGA